VQLADKRESSLTNTQVTKQQGKTKTKEQQAKEIRSSISVNASQAEKEITMIQGNAVADAKMINANATSTAANMTIMATADAYQLLETNIGITPESSMAKFIFLSDLQTNENTPILYNVNKTLVRMGT